MLGSFIEDMKKPQAYFKDQPAKGIVTYAFEVPDYFPQHKFYKKMGFKQSITLIIGLGEKREDFEMACQK